MSGADDDPTIILSDIGQVLAEAEAEAKVKNACLVAIGGELNHTVFELTSGRTVIGRSSDVTYCLEFEGVSRHHLLIEVEQLEKTATITDLGSRNGTYLNNKRLQHKEILRKGDIVKLGVVALQYIPPGDPEHLTFAQLAIETNTDLLTGCLNRLYLNQATDAAVKYSISMGSPLSLLLFDIDHFTKVNHSFGNEGGDFILQEIAGVVRNHCVGESDVYARFDGEAFAILLPDTNLEQSFRIAELLRKTIEKHEFRYDFRKWPITTSVGIAEVSESVSSGKKLFKLAAKSVDLAKEKGRNQVSSVQISA